MEIKAKEKLKSYIERTNKIKWECIRRNKNYMKDYFRFEKERKYAYSSRFILKSLKYFNKKYGICFPLSPSEEYQDFLCSQLFKSKAVTMLGPSEPELLFPIRGGISPEKHSKLRRSLRKIKLQVNLDFPLEVIMFYIKDKIQRYKNIRKNEMSRKRIDKFFHYLKIFDLLNQGRSRENLAKKFYRNDSGGISYAKKKVQRDYIRARKLIYSGYRQIR